MIDFRKYSIRVLKILDFRIPNTDAGRKRTAGDCKNLQ